MAIQIKQLGSGTIAAGGTLDPVGSAVGANKTRIVKTIRLVNAAPSASATINVYLNAGSGDVLISPSNLVLASQALYADDREITMETGHKLKITVVNAGPVHYVVSGIERDV
jgi:hypothetical protein